MKLDYQAYLDASERKSGKTLPEWEAIWKRRRIEHLNARRLNGHKRLTMRERETTIRYYDLDPEDFRCVSELPIRYQITQDALQRIASESPDAK